MSMESWSTDGSSAAHVRTTLKSMSKQQIGRGRCIWRAQLNRRVNGLPSGICFRFVGLDFVSVLHWLEGDANRVAGDGTLAGGSGRLPFRLVASGVSRITSIPEPPIPGGPRIKFEPTHVGCYGLIGGVVRVTHRRRNRRQGRHPARAGALA